MQQSAGASESPEDSTSAEQTQIDCKCIDVEMRKNQQKVNFVRVEDRDDFNSVGQT
jgi:hypothetical protein